MIIIPAVHQPERCEAQCPAKECTQKSSFSMYNRLQLYGHDQVPYASSNSLIPSYESATRGSKITLNGNGWTLTDWVKANWSIGDVGSDLTVMAHKTSEVLRNTDLPVTHKQLML